MKITTFAAIYIGSYEVSMKVFEIRPGKKIRQVDYIRSRLELGLDAYSKGVIGYELVEELCQPCRLIARARGLDFSLRLPEGYPALAAPGPFRRAVSSILSNAVTYAQAGGLVSVYLEDGALVVENQCDPIPAGEVRRLFQPFCRPDLSRSRESGGNGLGLYFADSLLTAMGLRYAFGPMEEPPGMRFTIWLE